MPRKAAKTDANAAVEGKRYPLNMRTTFELRRDLEVRSQGLRKVVGSRSGVSIGTILFRPARGI